jgi:hypothetical protein
VGSAAFLEVKQKLVPFLELITNGKRWWLTETGMTSYKTNNKEENENTCLNRRLEGGSSYGKTEQSWFYREFVNNFNVLIDKGGALWNRFEGVTFFLPQDVNIEGGRYAGYGLHWPAKAPQCLLEYPCQKPAAVTFNQYYSNAESLPPATWLKENIGGYSSCGAQGSEPALSSWGVGRLDLFVCGKESALWHRAWVQGTGWGAWENLGGVLTSPPSAVSWGPNRIDVVARGSYNHVWHWAWNGSSWSAEDIYGEVSSAPAVSSRGVGILDVFVRGMDNALWVKSLLPGSGWNSWTSIGGVLTSAPSSVSWSSSRIDVVARGSYNHPWHWAWNGASWSAEDLNGEVSSAPAVSSRGAGTLDVFARGMDSALWHKHLEAGTGWDNWESFGGALASGPSAVSWGGKRIDIVNTSTSSSVAHWYWGQ